MQEKLTAMKALVPDDFCRTCLDSAIKALADEENVLRVNFYSTAMRMLYEHVANNLSPTAQVMQAPWFQPQKEDGRPTRRQRIIFAVQGGLTDEFVSDDLGIEIGDIHARLVSAVDELSHHIHGGENTIVTDIDAQNDIVAKTADAVAGFFHVFNDCRSTITEAIEMDVSSAAVDALLSETILEIDELATHHSIEGVYVNSVHVKNIGSEAIVYEVDGSVSVTLQWGSNSDLRAGDGAEMDESFPFSAEITIPIEDIFNLDDGEVVYGVDTSKWRDDGSDEYSEPENWDLD